MKCLGSLINKHTKTLIKQKMQKCLSGMFSKLKCKTLQVKGYISHQYLHLFKELNSTWHTWPCLCGYDQEDGSQLQHPQEGDNDQSLHSRFSLIKETPLFYLFRREFTPTFYTAVPLNHFFHRARGPQGGHISLCYLMTCVADASLCRHHATCSQNTR